MQHPWQQVLGKCDTLSSGCAPTLIGLEDITEEAMDSGPLLKNIKEKKRKNLMVGELGNDINSPRLLQRNSGRLM